MGSADGVTPFRGKIDESLRRRTGTPAVWINKTLRFLGLMAPLFLNVKKVFSRVWLL
jgi:hypothetical protein